MYHRVINQIDHLLDYLTMYRLVLYFLIALLVVAGGFSLFGLLPFSFSALLFSTLFLVIVSWAANTLFAWAYSVPANAESYLITALILALIISPAVTLNDYAFLFWAALIAMASKYLLAINKKHLFNPAAVAVVITSIVLGQSASWWIGTKIMAPFVLVLGLLITRKIRRTDLVFGFFEATLVFTLGFVIKNGVNLTLTLEDLFFHSPLFFFGFVMLTEPLTTPPTKTWQILYGSLVGLLIVPQVHLGSLFFTPELALCVGNVFSYLVSPKQKFILTLKEKIPVAADIYDFVFTPQTHPAFIPGQYMEWTLPHDKSDSRGNRRYFTIASSPTERDLRLGVKFYPQGSSYKKALLSLDSHTSLVAGQLAGSFTLPADPHKKLVFIAGGIGITPFRSIIKYLLDQGEKRDLVLLYSNKSAGEIAYREVFVEAAAKLGVKTVYTLTARESVPANWQGRVGRIGPELIRQEIPDWRERLFYLSGPHMLVTGFETTLREMGLPSSQIKVDFFPGFV